MDRTTAPPRPLTSPAVVGCAAVGLLAVAAASFTSGLTRQLRLPRPVNTARVVVMPPKEAPAPVDVFAYMAPVAPPPVAVPARSRRHPPPAPDEAPPAARAETVEVARAAPLDADDVAAIVPITPPTAPQAAPAP